MQDHSRTGVRIFGNVAIGALIKALPESCALHLANSSVIRYAQLYQVPSTIEVCCNRGTSGIEGSLSTAVGYAAGSDKLNFIAIGDLSFFYDMNALWNINVRPNLRILLLNNGGGEIFHTLPGLDMSVHRTSILQPFTRHLPKDGRKNADSFING